MQEVINSQAGAIVNQSVSQRQTDKVETNTHTLVKIYQLLPVVLGLEYFV